MAWFDRREHCRTHATRTLYIITYTKIELRAPHDFYTRQYYMQYKVERCVTKKNKQTTL